jgi:hypothetical protein
VSNDNKLFILGTMIAAGYGLHRVVLAAGRAIDRDFNGLILSDIARWLADRLPAPVERVEAALDDLLNGRPAGRLLAGLDRVECEILPADAPTRRKVRTHIWFKTPNGVKAGSVTRVLAYEEIPGEARAEFIQTGHDRFVWAVYERDDSPVSK